MNSGNPTAIIFGIEHFVARKLAKEILAKEINVIGIGEYVNEFTGENNIRLAGNIEEAGDIKGRINYVFDFIGEEKAWELARNNEAKLTIISVNDPDVANKWKSKARDWEVNGRLVEAFGVYGPGMEESNLLTRTLRQAVENKNLELPGPTSKVRLLSVADAVEAILRASFLSGTEGQVYLILGKEISSEEIARVLIDEAKMTRMKVMESDEEVKQWDEEKVAENWRKLRWQPEEEFEEGVKETLQYYFSELDEKNRRKQVQTTDYKLTSFKMKEDKEGPAYVKDFGEAKEEKPKIREKVVVEEMRDYGETKEENEEIEEIEEEPAFVDYGEAKPAYIRQLADFGEAKPAFTRVSTTADKPAGMVVIKMGRPGRRKFGWWVAGIIMMVGLGVIVAMGMNLILLTWKAGVWAKSVPKKIEERKYEEIDKNNEKYLDKLSKIDKKIDDGEWNRLVWVRRYQMGLKVLEEVLSLEKKSLGLIRSTEGMSSAMFEDKDLDWQKELEKIKTGLDEVETEMGKLQARLGGDWSWLPARFKAEPQRLRRQMEKIRITMDLSRKMLSFAPEFLGLDGKRREYLILFQNEMELRPSGGFIGAYGILSFEGGKLMNLDIKDVYEADGQLKGHVEPPEEIKTILGEAGWFMRDANWETNFTVASSQIQWFLEKEAGRKVDGVIGINLAVAKAILEVTGEVEVMDFREKVNKDNLFEQAEFYAETKFFPGSNQKASFLGGLGKQLFEEIRGMPSRKKLELYETMIDQLEKNEIQVALNNKKAAEELGDLGWDGAIYVGKCGMDRCLADYLYLVEANLGVNKANYFIYRNIEQVVEIKMRSVEKVIKVTYENTAKNTNWPGGDYKNYLRIYLPAEAYLTELSLVDGYNAGDKKVYLGNEIKIREVNGKKEIGLLVVVPVRSKKILEIKYTMEINLEGKDKFSYLYYIQRQSGYGDTGLVTLVSFPEGWQPLQVEPAASLVAGKLLFNQKLDKDIKMGVELGK